MIKDYILLLFNLQKINTFCTDRYKACPLKKTIRKISLFLPLSLTMERLFFTYKLFPKIKTYFFYGWNLFHPSRKLMKEILMSNRSVRFHGKNGFHRILTNKRVLPFINGDGVLIEHENIRSFSGKSCNDSSQQTLFIPFEVSWYKNPVGVSGKG